MALSACSSVSYLTLYTPNLHGAQIAHYQLTLVSWSPLKLTAASPSTSLPTLGGACYQPASPTIELLRCSLARVTEAALSLYTPVAGTCWGQRSSNLPPQLLLLSPVSHIATRAHLFSNVLSHFHISISSVSSRSESQAHC